MYCYCGVQWFMLQSKESRIQELMRNDDLQTLLPWDRDTVVNSVKKQALCNCARHQRQVVWTEMSASIQERCFWHLEAPIIKSQAGTRRSLTQPSGTTYLARRELRKSVKNTGGITWEYLHSNCQILEKEL